MKIELEFKDEQDYHQSKNIGLSIILKYSPSVDIRPGHDKIWAGDYEEILVKMTKEEKAFMENGRWFEDEEAWSTFL